MLIVVRHGRTALNASQRLLGRLDPPLDEVGLAQAAAVAAVLAADRVDQVVASPLLRAMATAQAVADAAGVGVDVDERWVEVDYGVVDGMPLSEVPADMWQRWRDDPGFAPDGGESLAAVASRVEQACTDLLAQATDRNVVVVTHVSPVKAAVGWALGVGHAATWRTFVSPGSVTRIGAGPAGPVLRSFNEQPGPPLPPTAR